MFEIRMREKVYTRKEWEEMIERNYKLTLEVVRTKNENRILHQQLSVLVMGKLLNHTNKCDAVVQTDEFTFQESIPDGKVSTINSPGFRDSISQCQSPHKVRMSTNLLNRVQDDCTQKEGSPRLSRLSKRPVSYKEPCLRVKVRQGFKFFHFED
jgi:hypothetical protein